MTYIPFYGQNTNSGISRLFSFFRCKNALSEQTAIAVSDLDWLEIGIVNADPRILKLYKDFLILTKDDKYWFDVDGLKVYIEKQTKFLRIFLQALGAFIFFGGLILFFSSYQSEYSIFGVIFGIIFGIVVYMLGKTQTIRI